MTATSAQVACPVCGGPVWDNRATKKNPKQPDFKCKDKACSGVIWPPRSGSAPRQATQPVDKPEWMVEQELEERRFVDETTAPAPTGKLDALLDLYSTCFAHASRLAGKAKVEKNLDVDASAMAATLFIQACQKGLI